MDLSHFKLKAQLIKFYGYLKQYFLQISLANIYHNRLYLYVNIIKNCYLQLSKQNGLISLYMMSSMVQNKYTLIIREVEGNGAQIDHYPFFSVIILGIKGRTSLTLI